MIRPTTQGSGSQEGAPGRPGRSLSHQAGFVIAARGTAFAIAFAVPIVMVRVISQEAYGYYRQALFVFSFFQVILQLGMTQSLYYFYPREPGRRRALLTQTVLFLGAMGLGAALILSIGRRLVAAYFNDAYMAELAPLVGTYLALMIVSSIVEILPIIRQQVRLAFCIIVATESLRAVLVIGVAVATRDVEAILGALVVASAARAVFLVLMLRHQGLLGRGPAGSFHLREQFAYAAPLGLLAVVVTLVQMTDRLYVSRYFDASQFAIYAVGCFQLPIITIVFQSASSVMLGRMAELQKAGLHDAMIALQRNAIRKLALVAIPAVAGALVLGHDLITVLFTDAYAASVPIFMIFLALILRSATAHSIVLRAFGLTGWMFRASLLSLPVAVVLAVTLTPILGLVGPAIAVVCAVWVLALVQLWKVGRLLGTGLRGLFPWRSLAANTAVAAVVALALAVARAASPLPPAANLLAGGALYVGAFLTVAVVTGVIRRDELASARRELARRIGRPGRQTER
ncbi:MAG: oligosaccharide flippase family protein [Candidatus Eiseniibacteriota bacterium]|jgi:O-antigen/teichoic acid export membrane protein